MSSTTAQSHEPSAPSPPDLVPIYAHYLAAFNAHSWPDITTYLSPTCHATFRGKLMGQSRAEMKPNYERHFARGNNLEVTMISIKQIERAPDAGAEAEEGWKRDFRWGLNVVLRDPTMAQTVMVNYWYRVEDGRWIQGWHEILDSVADETA